MATAFESENNGVLSCSGDGIGGVGETTVANGNLEDGRLDSGTGEEGQCRGKEKHYGWKDEEESGAKVAKVGGWSAKCIHMNEI
jgi:hypothetical protein